MIFGNIYNLGNLSVYPNVLKLALKYLSETDLKTMNTGTYELIGKDMFIQIIDLKTDVLENKHPEIHKNYLDIHFLAKGSEKIGFCIDLNKNEIYKDYDKKKDIKFYKNCASESFIDMVEGDFVVFFPNNIHRPGCILKNSEIIRKIVIKIHKKLLKELS